MPEGFAHGFVTLSATAECVYQTTDYWAPACERCIKWDDPQIGIQWPITATPILSEKDKRGVALDRAELFHYKAG